MTFPSIDSALDYVRGKLQEFYNQRVVIKRDLKKIYDLSQLAQKTNDQEALGKLIVLRAQTVTLLDEQLRLEDRLRPFAEYFHVQPNLGLLPVLLVGAALGAASLLYLHFEKLRNQAKALDLVAKGMLSASEAEAIVNPGFFSSILGGGLSSLWLYAIGGGALYVWLISRRTT